MTASHAERLTGGISSPLPLSRWGVELINGETARAYQHESVVNKLLFPAAAILAMTCHLLVLTRGTAAAPTNASICTRRVSNVHDCGGWILVRLEKSVCSFLAAQVVQPTAEARPVAGFDNVTLECVGMEYGIL